MPFCQETKARLFIKCSRICCLCFKQCGVNIEIAHIIPESHGGSNDEDNGIPLCFDCHQETGGYNVDHPRGNKFTEKELKVRRNQLYELVESGFLQAQIITGRIHDLANKEELKLSNLDYEYKPGVEAKQILSQIEISDRPVESIPLKLKLLGDQDRAYIIDTLVRNIENIVFLYPLRAIIVSDLCKDKGIIILEQILRRATMSNNLKFKKIFMETAPVEILRLTDEGLRIAFFTEVISIIESDQFGDVNLIVPSVEYVQAAIPECLIEKYILAMLEMAKSNAWNAKPSAQRALMNLPEQFAKIGLEIFKDRKFLFWHREAFYKGFIKYYSNLSNEKDLEMLNDFVNMDEMEFFAKWPANLGN